MRATIASLVLVTVVFASLPSDARADVTISVTPSFLEFAVDPGATFEQAMTVSNDGSTATGMLASVTEPDDTRSDTSSASWIEVSPTEFRLGPGESQKVAIQVRVPNDVSPGGRYATISFRTATLKVGGPYLRDFLVDLGLERR